MMKPIIIKNDQGEKIKQFLQQEHIDYEIYQEPKKDWENQEKKALQEWQNLSNKELIDEWEELSNNDWENN